MNNYVMNNYKEMYLKLFNAITDALQEIESGNSDKAKKILISAQEKAESVYINGNV